MLRAPSGGHWKLDAAPYHNCSIAADRTLHCWGETESPPGGRWAEISAGYGHNCAIDEDGQIACWGADDRGQASPPE
jgi:hypothetical protein